LDYSDVDENVRQLSARATVVAVYYVVSANIVVRCSSEVEAITSVSYVVSTYDISVAMILDPDTPAILGHINEVSANNVIVAQVADSDGILVIYSIIADNGVI
jgi:hypothetical protein